MSSGSKRLFDLAVHTSQTFVRLTESLIEKVDCLSERHVCGNWPVRNGSPSIERPAKARRSAGADNAARRAPKEVAQ